MIKESDLIESYGKSGEYCYFTCKIKILLIYVDFIESTIHFEINQLLYKQTPPRFFIRSKKFNTKFSIKKDLIAEYINEYLEKYKYELTKYVFEGII